MAGQSRNRKNKGKKSNQPKVASDKHQCGFCSQKFTTLNDLYIHQQDEHDPDKIMFSELGLPK